MSSSYLLLLFLLLIQEKGTSCAAWLSGNLELETKEHRLNAQFLDSVSHMSAIFDISEISDISKINATMIRHTCPAIGFSGQTRGELRVLPCRALRLRGRVPPPGDSARTVCVHSHGVLEFAPARSPVDC